MQQLAHATSKEPRVRLDPNFLLSLPTNARDQIMGMRTGVARVSELFKNVTNQLIPRSAIEQVAQQRDPLRRARQTKERLAIEGLLVLCVLSPTRN